MADTNTTINNNLKEEITGDKTETSSSANPNSIHIVNIDQSTTAASPDLSEMGHDALEEKKASKFKWGKKNKDGKPKEEKESLPKVSYMQLYRFASTWDWTCVA